MASDERSDRGLEPVAERDEDPSYIFANEQAIARLARTFEESAKRWELVVYPSLLAFIVLAAYGFYLVYSLTSDVSSLTRAIDPQMGPHMTELSASVDRLASSVEAMAGHMAAMERNMGTMTVSVTSMDTDMETLKPMLAEMQQMNRSALAMSYATDQMGRDLTVMNHNFSRPLGFMNSFTPW